MHLNSPVWTRLRAVDMDDYLNIEHVEGHHQEQRERQPELRFMRVEERGWDLHHLHVERRQ